MTKRRIGAHVSAAGGVDKAIDRAVAIGCNSAQIFSGSPRVWKRSDIDDSVIEKMVSKRKENDVEPIFTHSLYLVNLASDKLELLRKSFDALRYDLEFDARIAGEGIIVHLGSHLGKGWDFVKDQVATKIDELLKHTSAESTFLIENSAGQKGKLCSDLSEIRWLFDQLRSKRVGWCFDTCHGHAAGYALGNEQLAQSNEGRGLVVDAISDLNLWDGLKCIHVNDSKDPYNSGRDRHENIGFGQIPVADLQQFLQYQKLITIPLATEVPGMDGNGPDAENVAKIKELCGAFTS